MKLNIETIMDILDALYPNAECTLEYNNALQLLVATQLAAQCTDQRVNIVTKKLFEKYITAQDFADANIEELEQDIKTTGFFHRKAQNIKQCCKLIVQKYNGEVPDKLEELLTLPGMGRKSSNVVLGVIYGVPGIIVDTHAKRLSKRIGLTRHDLPAKIEIDLMNIIPKQNWVNFCHQLVFHGRAICKARHPKCLQCDIRKFCNYGMEKVKHDTRHSISDQLDSSI